MGEKHLQISLCDVAAGRASVASVRMRSLRLLLCLCIVAGALVVTVHTTAAAPRIACSCSTATGACTSASTRALPPAPAGPSEARRRPARAVARRERRRRPPRAAPPRAHVRSELKRLLRARRDRRRDARALSPRVRRRDPHRETAERHAPQRAAGGDRATCTTIAARGAVHGRAPAGAVRDARAQPRSGGRAGRCSATASASSSPTASWCGSTTRARGSSCRCSARSARRTGCGSAGSDQKLRALLDEMVTLASERGGALAWEYLFDFGGGAPPWTSGMAQATGIQALARAGQRLRRAGVPRSGAQAR